VTRLHVEQGELFGTPPVMPEGLAYAPELIGIGEEARLLEEIAKLALAEAQYRQYTARRRTASFGAEYDFSANALETAPPIPAFLLPLRERLAAWIDVPAERFTHALVSEYRPGTPLGWHRDAPDFELIAGISLGTACRMRFRPYPPDAARRSEAFSLDLEPRSGYVMRDAARWGWQHSIPAVPRLRHSVTFRTLRKRGSRA
jgi:alkylated DNA repair dioxygenase AlkB